MPHRRRNKKSVKRHHLVGQREKNHQMLFLGCDFTDDRLRWGAIILVYDKTGGYVKKSITSTANTYVISRERKAFGKQKVTGIPSSRAAKLRMSWFVIGTSFGVFVSSMGHWASDFSLDAFEAASLPEIPSLTLAFPDDEDEEDIADTRENPAQVAEAKETIPEPPPLVWPREVAITVSSGDRLIDILTNQGIAYQDAHQIVQQMRSSFDPRKLRSGHEMTVTLEKDTSREEAEAAKLKEMTIRLSSIEEVKVHAAGQDKWRAERLKEKVLTETGHGGGSIKGSFYVTAKRLGIPDKAIVEMIRAYSYDVDFQRDIRAGDALEVMYDKLVTKDGDFVGTGDVLYAELKTRGKSLKVYSYTNGAGVTSYYNENGENVKKALLRTPVDGARISSGFGMRRHPILGYSKMHRGIDFAAPKGTPIYAAGDGVVEYASPFSGYGNYLRIRHNGTYKTAYGHISRFASGIRRGSKVRQGQVVAYVGATGLATGPHLHYEILRANTQVNPAGVKFAGGDRLAGRELAKFQEVRKDYETRLANLKATPTKLAAAQ